MYIGQGRRECPGEGIARKNVQRLFLFCFHPPSLVPLCQHHRPASSLPLQGLRRRIQNARACHRGSQQILWGWQIPSPSPDPESLSLREFLQCDHVAESRLPYPGRKRLSCPALWGNVKSMPVSASSYIRPPLRGGLEIAAPLFLCLMERGVNGGCGPQRSDMPSGGPWVQALKACLICREFSPNNKSDSESACFVITAGWQF